MSRSVGLDFIDLLVVWGWFVVHVDHHHPLDAVVPHLLQLLPLAVLPSIESLAVRGVDWLRRGRPATRTCHEGREGGADWWPASLSDTTLENSQIGLIDMGGIQVRSLAGQLFRFYS